MTPLQECKTSDVGGSSWIPNGRSWDFLCREIDPSGFFGSEFSSLFKRVAEISDLFLGRNSGEHTLVMKPHTKLGPVIWGDEMGLQKLGMWIQEPCRTRSQSWVAEWWKIYPLLWKGDFVWKGGGEVVGKIHHLTPIGCLGMNPVSVKKFEIYEISWNSLMTHIPLKTHSWKRVPEKIPKKRISQVNENTTSMNLYLGGGNSNMPSNHQTQVTSGGFHRKDV